MGRSLRASVLAVAAAGLLSVATSRAASPDELDGPWHGGWRAGGHEAAGMLLEHADWLSERTAADVRAAFEASYPRAKELREQLQAARHELRQLLMQDAPDQNAVLAQVEHVGNIQIELHKQRISTLLAVRSLLTPEERAQLRARLAARRAQRLGRLQEACGQDIAKLCSGAQPGPALFGCLREQKPADLTPACRAQLARPRFGFGRGHRGPGAPALSSPDAPPASE